MRILYLADIRFPLERANGIQTFETCAALAARGHEVVLAARPDTAVPARDPFAFYGHAGGPRFDVRRAPAAVAPIRRSAYVAFAIGQATAGRHDVVMTRDLGVAASLLRLPSRARPPLVYESHGYAPEVARALPTLLSSAPAPPARKLRRLSRRERRVWQRAEGYVTITAALLHELTAHFGERPRIAVVPDGVRLDPHRVFEPRRPADPPTVAYAGHLYPWKGADVLVEALSMLADVRGVIVGGHPAEQDLPRIQQRIVRLGVVGRVTCAGLVPPGSVASYLAAADVLVLPNTCTTISERYTSPLKLFEYMAAGRPIVASDLPAIREVVRHAESAWLVAPGSPDALATGIRRVLEDGALAARLAGAAWHGAEQYSWIRRAERLEPVLAAARGAR